MGNFASEGVVSFFARSLAFLEKNPHLCNAQHLNQATTFANFAVGIFYAQGDTYSSDPRVESLMASQPDLGVEQRESGTFFCSLSRHQSTYCFI